MISSNVAEPRVQTLVQTLVLLAFAGASLLLAAFGVAGVMAYLVATRASELAVRMALGATSRRLVAQRARYVLLELSTAARCLVLHGMWPDATLNAQVPSTLGSADRPAASTAHMTSPCLDRAASPAPTARHRPAKA